MVDGLVSIIMPSYNTEQYIGESIESVLAQTYANWELIIVDDCSTDNTENIILKYNDSRIKYLKNEKNSGAAVSRNRALKEAKGRWIAFLDSDDLWLPEKLEKQIKFMEQNNYSFTYTNYEEIDEQSNRLNIKLTGPNKISKMKMNTFCWVGCLTVMYDRNVVGLLQIKPISKRNDYAMWLKVINFADCYLLNETLALYRRRKGSISNIKLIKKFKWHYYLFRNNVELNPILSVICAMLNVLGFFYKKIFYTKKIN